MLFNENLESIAKARTSNASAATELYKARINTLKQNSAATAAELSTKLALQQQAEKAAKEALQQSVKNLYTENSPQTLITNWDAKIPVLLMPLRLETTFVEVEGRQELWLRIYPDDIAVQQHEPLLSEKEFAEGKQYWMVFFDADKNATAGESLKKGAWDHLKNTFGANRSAWIARQTIPANWSNRATLAKKEDLIFPNTPLLKTEEWTQAPRTQILPDKFIVSIFKDTIKVHEQTGNLVPDTLFLGHDPFKGGEAFTKTDFGIEFAKEFSWMSDFEEAVNVGMGLKIELRDDFYIDLSQRLIDRIAVLGVYLSADAAQSQEILGNLLENHRYTEGLAIIPQGTPTNNAEDNSSGFVPNEDQQPKGYFEIPATSPFQRDPLCDGNRLASALGIEPSIIEGISHDTCRDHAEAVTINSALFPATIGYYFDTLLDRYVPDSYVALLRTFFENNISGAGPLPAIRVGDQPYGLLATSDFANWKTIASNPDQSALLNKIYNVLSFFSGEWEVQSKKVLYIGKEKDENNNALDPKDVFLNVVGLEPSSISFERRTGYLNDLPLFQASSPNLLKFKEEAASNETMVNKQLASFGGSAFTGQQLFSSLIFLPENRVYIPEKNLIDGLPDSETRLLPHIAEIGKNYLAWLADIVAMEVLEKQDFSGAKAPNYLLYLLARHALLLELRRSALEILNKKEEVISRSAFDKTYLNLNGSTAAARDLTIWEVLYADSSTIDSTSTSPSLQSIGDKLLKQSAGNIKALKSKFRLLSLLPTARLERLLTGHLDCLTYRLDAWQSGLFFERLESRRKDTAAPAKGIYLGAFGYLENLLPAPKTILDTPGLPKSLQPTDGSVVYRISDNAGLLHAPSLDHAAAAALLMAGYRNNAEPQEPGIFAVNLSSSRIRKAMQILEGVRNGQSLEALLGYQFERACHERTLKGNNLNQFILAFRIKYPIENQYNKQEGEDNNAEVFRPVQPDVVNGLKMLKEKTADLFANTARPVVPGLSDAEFSKLVNLLLAEADSLSDTLDAVKDLLLSESVFQAASGNTARTGAVLEALREGAVPPDPGILKTPKRSRFAFNHLISVHFPQAAADLNPWGAAIPLSPASQFEPGLNLWLSKIFGNPALIFCSASHINKTTSVPTPPKLISLAALKIQPIDFLIYSGKDSGSVSSEIERRIIHHYRLLTNLPPDEQVNIDIAVKIARPRKSFAEIFPLAKSIYSVLSQSRAIHAQDYIPFTKGQSINTNNKNGYDIAELQERVKTSIQSLEKILAQLDNVVPNGDPKNESNPANLNLLFKQWEAQIFSDARFTNFAVIKEKIDEIIQLRIGLASFDISNAWPVKIPSGNNNNLAGFLADTAHVWKAVHLLLENAKSILAKLNEAENIEEEAGILSKLAKLLLGANFPVMPKFKYQNPNDFTLAFRDRKQILKYYSGISGLPDTIVPDDWFQSVSEVRSRSGKWEFARSLSEIHGNADLSLLPVQLPYRKNDSWLAVQFPETDITGKPFGISTDTISCAIFGPDAVNVNSLQSGLLIDEWSETIPVDTETSGIAFNYNQPDAMPPQSLLLAVYPGAEANWSWDALLGTVMDTFKRAKMRAVEPRHFANNQLIHHFLPGIVAPVNIKGNNISLDFAVASDAFLNQIPRGHVLYEAHIAVQAATQ